MYKRNIFYAVRIIQQKLVF